MRLLLEKIMLVPQSAERRNDAVEGSFLLSKIDVDMQELVEQLAQITAKSGTLLTALGLFLTAITLGGEKSPWTQMEVRVSIVALLVSVLLVMSNLRAITPIIVSDKEIDRKSALFEVLTRSQWRGVRLNIALYLSIATVMLLGIAAICNTLRP